MDGEGGREEGESGLVLSLMRILINPAEAALRPPGSLDQKNQTASKGEEGGRGGTKLKKARERRKSFYRLMKQKSVRGEAGKGKKAKGKCRERQKGGERWEDGQRR